MNVQQSKTPYLLLLAFCLCIATFDAFQKEEQSAQTITIKVDSIETTIQQETLFFTHLNQRANP